MIWFTCKKCGKTIGRPESSAGALIFCDCGHGSRVPWESTARPPRAEPAPAAALPLAEPIRFDPAAAPTSAPSPRLERRSRNSPIDANACFNHASVDKSSVCAACGLSFCDRCTTTFRGESLCAPCKNYRTRLLQRRPEPSRLALASFIVALAAGPILLALLSLIPPRQTSAALLLALLPVGAAIAAGALALRWIDRGPNRAGQHLAISGIGLSAVVGVVTVLLVLAGHKIWT